MTAPADLYEDFQPVPIKWDRRFLGLAALVAGWSKDPGTQAGAAIIRPDRTVASVGYNGFPRGLQDSPALLSDREAKLSRTVHCEMNAIISARERLDGYALFTWPFLTCDRCAVHVAQAGIARVVTVMPDAEREERWGAAFDLARSYYREAGIQVVEYSRELILEVAR